MRGGWGVCELSLAAHLQSACAQIYSEIALSSDKVSGLSFISYHGPLFWPLAQLVIWLLTKPINSHPPPPMIIPELSTSHSTRRT